MTILRRLIFLVCLLSFPITAYAIDGVLGSFKSLYDSRLDDVRQCTGQNFRLCSDSLRNEGNGPFILHHNEKVRNVVVLFHGLSDSPFYYKAVAQHLYELGMNVMVPLLPAHGLKQANKQMQDGALSEKWIAHVDEVMSLAPELGERVYIGGFSTGGALATHHVMANPDRVDGLLLFSGALALSNNAEKLSRIWGIQFLAKILDGNYETDGPNPFKYPSVSNSAGIELMEIIDSIRHSKSENVPLSLPVFAVHSEVDTTTPIEGVEQLLDYNKGTNTAFFINASNDVCHGDIMLTHLMVQEMAIDRSLVNVRKPCALPKANPQFRRMINLLTTYFEISESK